MKIIKYYTVNIVGFSVVAQRVLGPATRG